MARTRSFAIPPALVRGATAGAAELAELVELMDRKSLGLLRDAAESLLEFWALNGPPEDATLVADLDHIRSECARELAIPLDRQPDVTATEWAQRWRTATDETRPSLAADIRALPEEMRDEIRQLVVAK